VGDQPAEEDIMPFCNHAQILCICISLFLATSAGATTLYVNGSCGDDAWTGMNEVCAAPNGPKASIQAGIDASIDGDTVLVAPGTYFESINFHGRTITVKSTHGDGATTIDGSGIPNSVVKIISGEGPETVFEGFTVTGGSGTLLSPTLPIRRGGGLYVLDASPMVRSCTFIENSADDGGGVLIRGSTSVFFDCIMQNNIAEFGGGMHAGANHYTNSINQFINCHFIDNVALQEGGAVRGAAGDPNAFPTFLNCSFSGNTAPFGGAIFRQNGSVRYSNCTFEDNNAGLGGAVYSRVFQDDYAMTFDECTFAGNEASGGGAMYIFDDTATFGEPKNNSFQVMNCDFAANGAVVSGGAIYCDQSTPFISECMFDGNFVDAFLGEGGAISSEVGAGPVVFDSVLMRGDAGSGGLLYVGPKSSALLLECALESSIARQGAAAFCDTSGTFEAYTCTFIDNLALESGGGVWSSGSQVTLEDCTFDANEANDRGAGIYGDAGSIELQSCTIVNNGALLWGAGAYVTATAHLKAMDCEFSGNQTVAQSGATAASRNGGFIEFTNCVVGDDGSNYTEGVSIDNENEAVFRFTLFQNVNDSAIRGGTVLVEDCMFVGNEGSSGDNGGAISSSTITVRRSTFRDHDHLVISAGDDAIVEDCEFVNNTSSLMRMGSGLIQRCTFDGGFRGIEIFDGPVRMEECIMRNIEGRYFDLNFADVTLVECDIEFNSEFAIFGEPYPPLDRYFRAHNCSFAGSGVLWDATFSDIGLKMTNCLLRDVQAVVSEIRGGDVIDLSNCTIDNVGTLFEFDTQTFADPMIRVRNCVVSGGVPATTNTDLVNISYSLITDGWPGEGNITGNPRFVDPANGDYRLRGISPCIDAGLNNAVGFDTADLDGDGVTDEFVPVDLDGNPRFRDRPATPDTGCGVGAIVDMGAYERQQGPTITPVFADIDGEGSVNPFDLAHLLGAWGPCSGCCLADLNVDGEVDAFDLALLLGAWTVN
jgi:predicted outer membrane repeat protein